MTALLEARPPASATPPAPQTFESEAWTVHEYTSVDSTNFVAAGLPAWHAVRAETQTAGRGRFQRGWVSDRGGLWLSAVVPAPASAGAALAALPLVAGLAVGDALRELGLQDFRLRWPNDVLVRDRKLAGLLLDQFVADRVVVGLGLNVANQPEACEATLRHQTTRLAELLPAAPPLRDLATLLLRHLRRLVLEVAQAGSPAVLSRINALWGQPRRVELDLDGQLRRGRFTAVDEDGRLLLQEDDGRQTTYQPCQVRHLREL